MARLVVLGGAESGVGSAVLAKVKGFDVFLSDSGQIKSEYAATLDKWGISYEQGGHSREKIFNADEVVKSPGIPQTAPIIRELREKGIHIISEIEFAARYDSAKKICITGSNGKTTTTTLIHYLLQEFEGDIKKIWQSNMFGKSFHELVNEDLQGKLMRMPEDVRVKLRETLERIINEGTGGLICIIL